MSKIQSQIRTAAIVAGVLLILLIAPAVSAGKTASGIEGALPASTIGTPGGVSSIGEGFSIGGQAFPGGFPGIVLFTKDPLVERGDLPDIALAKEKAAAFWGQKAGNYSGKQGLLDTIKGKGRQEPSGGQRVFVSGEGTVRFVNKEGGFYGIVTPGGDKLRPENLPALMKQDGLRVSFQGMARNPGTGGEWDTAISLISIDVVREQITGSGIVRFIDLEGGFFGIIGDDGKRYFPANLPAEFKVDGKTVSFSAHEGTEVTNTAMWGIPIVLDSIEASGSHFLSLQGSWTLVKINGKALIPGTSITATFGSDGKVGGKSGCNQYSAGYSGSGSSLTISEAVSTKMYCESPVGTMEQEAAYFSLLAGAARWSIDGGDLVIRDASGRDILVFSPAGPDRSPVLIEYSRTGGFAGFDDHLVLYEDGTGTVTRKESVRSVEISEPVIRDLLSHVTAANFPSLHDNYPAPAEGADYFMYTLTYQGKTVTTEDTGIPPVLRPVITILNEIVESAAPDDVIPPVSS